MEIFSGFILLMFVGGSEVPLEFTPRDSIVHCLSTKRKILRNQSGKGPLWVCQQGKVELKEINGEWHPLKILELD